MRVAIVLLDGFDELDAIGPYEVFQKAAEEGAPLTVSLHRIPETDSVTANHGLRIEPDGPFDEHRLDLLVVPGGARRTGDDAGAEDEVQHDDVLEVLVGAHDRGTTIAAVGTGAMLLGNAGLLENRPATTHPDARSDLREFASEVVDARVVDTGDVLTASGVVAGLDLALYVVEREFGAEIADRVRTRLDYESRGAVHRAD